MSNRTDPNAFGVELKRWRRQRRMSQLELASLASVSQRHLSFLETGRSRPSSEMVEHLGLALDAPLRGRNGMRHAAGFAPAYTEEPLDGSALSQIRESLETLVEAHDPFPAYVVDRMWNLRIANTAAARLTGLLLPSDSALALAGNVLRMFLHPDGARGVVVNWPEAAATMVERLGAECEANPADRELVALFEEVMGYEGVAALGPVAGRPSERSLLAEIHVQSGDLDLRLFTTISSLLGASDVTVEELRLETLLPADAATRQALGQLR